MNPWVCYSIVSEETRAGRVYAVYGPTGLVGRRSSPDTLLALLRDCLPPLVEPIGQPYYPPSVDLWRYNLSTRRSGKDRAAGERDDD